MENKKIEWPGWETVDIIGHGSFGEVYEIQRTIRGRTEKAALKVLSLPKYIGDTESLRYEGFDDESITQYYAECRDSIESEYDLIAEMKGHPNVVYCDDIISIPQENSVGWHVLIKMELLTPMRGSQTSQMTEADIIKLGADISNALVYCEKQHIIHRDIKPENIFVSRYGSYKLGDFGIAKTMEGTMGGTKVGTYDFMSPEVYNNKPYGTKVDMYSLGLVLYWMLNERKIPFLSPDIRPTLSEKGTAHVRRFAGEQIPPPKNGSDELKAIVLKACAFDPKDRFANAQEMLDALNALRYGGTVVCVQSAEHGMPVEHKPAAAVEAPVAKTKEKKSDTVRTYGSAERGYLVNIMKEFADKPWLSITNNGKTATFHSANLYWREIAAAVNKINKAIGCDEWTYEKMSVCDGDAANGFLADNGKIYVNWKKEPENRLRLIVTYKLINLW